MMDAYDYETRFDYRDMEENPVEVDYHEIDRPSSPLLGFLVAVFVAILGMLPYILPPVILYLICCRM